MKVYNVARIHPVSVELNKEHLLVLVVRGLVAFFFILLVG